MISERLIILRKTLNLTQQEFGLKIGLKHSTISDMERNYSSISESSKLLICQTFHVNRDWLETGIGNMFIDFNPVKDDFFNIFNSLNPKFQQFLLDSANHLLAIQDDL